MTGMLDGFLGRGAKAKAGKKKSRDDYRQEGKSSDEISKPAPKKKKIGRIEILPARVSNFDGLISDGGLEKGSTTLISGGTGTGKTTFCMQSLYNGALHGERGIFISFEEDPERIKAHMKKNFGWDFEKLEKKGLIAMMKINPTKIARTVEEIIESRTGSLRIEVKKFELPFKPDKICIDSLSALSIAFSDEDNYRKYVRELFETLEEYNSVNFVITETEQDPKIFSRTGVEEFLADGVVVFYSIGTNHSRENAIEILKLRSSKHSKKMIPFKIGKNGFDISVRDE